MDELIDECLVLPSGKHTKNDGKIHHFQWVNPLFRLGHHHFPKVSYGVPMAFLWISNGPNGPISDPVVPLQLVAVCYSHVSHVGVQTWPETWMRYGNIYDINKYIYIYNNDSNNDIYIYTVYIHIIYYVYIIIYIWYTVYVYIYMYMRYCLYSVYIYIYIYMGKL